MKSALVGIVGRPSAGKSSMMNRLCGAKISIVSPVPQTTRNRVRGILTRPGGQLVFMDTPGFHLSEKKFNLYMTDLVSVTLRDSDIVLYLVDGTRPFGEEERALLEKLRSSAKPCIIAINKSDQKGHSRKGHSWKEIRSSVAEALPGAPVHEVSALDGDGVEGLASALMAMAPEGDQLYPEEFYTDQEPEFRIAEIVREKAIAQTRAELPHALYVRLEDLEMSGDGERLQVRGFILVERESQKGIVVGRAGDKIRAIVSEAEQELRGIFPYPVDLDLRVKVDHDWRKRDPLLKRMIR
ncbi:MAG: GTPase Era [Spirochaetes bacterium RBG_13_68_11]|nr:MAG: GTPase Era [Spirochaetes bacterium RBG_13_68_11]